MSERRTGYGGLLTIIASVRKGPGMSISPKSMRFDQDSMGAELDNSLVSGVPPIWSPRLVHATPAQLQTCESSRRGLHWDTVDDDLSRAGLLAGWVDQTHWSSHGMEMISTGGEAL